MRHVISIILGGGRGTRLYPLTKLRAKPAVPLAGKYRLIDIPVSNCINSGIQKIFVLTQFNSASLNRHIGLTYQFGPLSEGFVEVLAAQQTPESQDWFQGTADAVRRVLMQLREFNVSDFLILSGDHLYRMDYRAFIEKHRENNADITIPVVAVEGKKASDFGLLKINDENRVLEFSEKPTGKALKDMQVDTSRIGLTEAEAKKKPYIASMGIYAFKRKVLIDLLTRNIRQIDFGKEIIPSAIDDYLIETYLFNDYWEDIGTIEAFYHANIDLLKAPNPDFTFYNPQFPIFTRQRFLPPTKIVKTEVSGSMISEGCLVYAEKIEHSLLGIRSFVDEGAHIKDSLIMGADIFLLREDRIAMRKTGEIPIGIGKNSVIQKAIIDKNARIGDDVKIINKDGIQEAEREHEGFYIRDGIVCVLKGAEIPHGTVI